MFFHFQNSGVLIAKSPSSVMIFAYSSLRFVSVAKTLSGREEIWFDETSLKRKYYFIK